MAQVRARGQLLPQAERIDTGIVATTRKFGPNESAYRESPPAVFQGPTLILGPRVGFLFASAVEYLRDHSSSYDRVEYVMWDFSPGDMFVASGPIGSLFWRCSQGHGSGSDD